MGNEQQNDGMMDKAAGNIKEGVGNVTGNDEMKYEGKAQQGEGQVKEGVGNVREGVENAVDDFNKDR